MEETAQQIQQGLNDLIALIEIYKSTNNEVRNIIKEIN